MRPVSRLLSGLVLVTSLSLPAYGQSPWLPREGQVSVNAWYTFETFDDFWKGREKTDFPDGPVVQHTQSVGIEYGLIEVEVTRLPRGHSVDEPDTLGSHHE
jgi:hypothetical protein